MKVELLFNNTGMEGDQTLGTSPYPTLAEWPDGHINMLDLYFVTLHFGENETNPNWNYMADVNPNRLINMLDIYLIQIHFGSLGSYITNLSGIKVVFSNGATLTPDNWGYISIPAGTTSFTVYKNDVPIGALVTFS